ncbi:MAG: hypothetical protein GY841_13490, partial [FCB group bacterium]|nr:hypothetical protein [FCB group bacterium]
MKNIMLILICIIFLAGIVAAEEIKVKTSGGTEKIDGFKDGKTLYYNLSGLNAILSGNLDWIVPGYSVGLTLDTNRFRFTVGSPYINYNDSSYGIILPIKIRGGSIYVPANTFSPLLNMARPENISWDNDGKTLRIDAEWYNITDMTINAKQNGLLIEIFMTKAMAIEIYESEGNWLNIDLPEGRINRPKILAAINKKHVRKINAFQFDKSAQISLRLRRGYKNFHHSFKTNPGRLQIALEDALFNPDTLASGMTRIGPDEKIDVIVIDAGHGGKDYGAIGRNKKTREKDVNLDIAKNLAKMIRKEKQFKVVMIRTKDVYVSLDERARIANKAKADLFISIHCNASTKPSAHGFQMFYLAPAKSDAARAAAQLENAPFLLDDPAIDKEGEDNLAFILNDMIQTEFITESADLAYMADIEMRKKIKVKSRG